MQFKIIEPSVWNYQALAHVYNLSCSPRSRADEDMKYADEHRDPNKFFKRLQAIDEQSNILGFAEAGHDLYENDESCFNVNFQVIPSAQGLGVGKSLYERISAMLAPRSPRSFKIDCDESQLRAVRFVKDRGFVEELRHIDSVLDLTQFQPSEFRAADLPGEITIQTFEELKAQDGDAVFHQKLFRLLVAIATDVPGGETTANDVTFEDFMRMLYRPGLLPKAYFIALHGNDYVGMSNYRSRATSGELDTGLTGVERTCRGKGLALALKVRGLAACKDLGIHSVFTSNASTNQGILALNRKMGFQPTRVEINFVKTF